MYQLFAFIAPNLPWLTVSRLDSWLSVSGTDN